MKKKILIILIVLVSTISYSQNPNKKNSFLTSFGYVNVNSDYDKTYFNFQDSLLSLSIQYKYNIYKRFFISPELYFASIDKNYQKIVIPDYIDILESTFNFTYSLYVGYDIIKRNKFELSTSIGGGKHKHSWKYLYLNKEDLPDIYKDKIIIFNNWGWNINIMTRYIFKNNSFLGVGYNYKNYNGFYFHTFQFSFGVKF